MKHEQVKIKIGIVGEHPDNDSLALSHLLKKVAKGNTQFVIMSKNNSGGRLDSAKFLKNINAEFLAENIQYLILVRDLDGLNSEEDKLIKRINWFEKTNKAISYRGIFFLVIYELEALILADIDSFNEYYGLKTKPIGNPLFKKNPKELIEKLTAKTQKGKYDENEAVKIFQILDFKTIYKIHQGEYSFQAFADELKDKNLIEF